MQYFLLFSLVPNNLTSYGRRHFTNCHVSWDINNISNLESKNHLFGCLKLCKILHKRKSVYPPFILFCELLKCINRKNPKI